MITYYNPRTGLLYTILGLIDEDKKYEVYQLKAKHNHMLILHVLKNENGRRYNVPRIEQMAVKPSGTVETRSEQATPWVRDGDIELSAREL